MRPFEGLGREYAKLFAAQTISNLGDGMTLVAGPLLAATLTRDPLQIAGLAFAQRLPWLLFALFSGALVDRLDKRRLMTAVDAFRSAAVGALGIAVLFDLASLPLLYGIYFLVGTAETLFDTASLSLLPTGNGGVGPRRPCTPRRRPGRTGPGSPRSSRARARTRSGRPSRRTSRSTRRRSR